LRDEVFELKTAGDPLRSPQPTGAGAAAKGGRRRARGR
jgi:hypothetical protein